MERNTLIAIVLSALVLFAYQSIFTPPKLPETVNKLQVNGIKDVKDVTTPPAQPLDTKTTNTTIKPEYFDIKTTQKDISFSNVGGSLHKIDFPGNISFPVTDVLSVSGFEDVQYTVKKQDHSLITLTYSDKNWQITKTFRQKDDNTMDVRMEIKNMSEISTLGNFNFTAFKVDDSRMDISQNNRDGALLEYSIYANNKLFRVGNAVKFNEKNYKRDSSNLKWAGFRNHYHALIVKPEFKTKEYEIKPIGDKELTVSFSPEDKNFLPGESQVYDFSVYAGPQNPWIMKKYKNEFEKIVAFSNFIIIEWIGQGIYYAIPFIHGILKSWGIAIILVSALIYGITYPLTMQSMMSMRKMQEVQPKITALRERYKNDPQKLNTEMVEIYRREKINPFGGCLPFLFQMPFFMALYQILWRAQYFQGQGFLWIKDLSQPDRLIIFPFYLPLIGNELNILPVLTGGIMFFQQKISSKNMIVTDEQQAMQQKMMMYILPVMMTFMFYKFASSWAIYFLVFYILSTLTQWKIAKLAAKK
jgi:YidC/Oxa1 family membrane protein insertase